LKPGKLAAQGRNWRVCTTPEKPLANQVTVWLTTDSSLNYSCKTPVSEARTGPGQASSGARRLRRVWLTPIQCLYVPQLTVEKPPANRAIDLQSQGPPFSVWTDGIDNPVFVLYWLCELPAPKRLLASCFNEGHRAFALQLPLSDRRCHHCGGPSRGSHGRF
jgi:hypothetical protein